MATALRALSLCLLVGCMPKAGVLEASVKSGLDMAAIAVNPSYEYAMDACAVRDTQLTDAIEEALDHPNAPDATGSVTNEAANAERELNMLRDRCERTKQAFEYIRSAHEEAIKHVEAGDLDRAELLLDQIKDSWNMLRGKL